MSRPVSLAARQALYAAESSEAFLMLVTLDHPIFNAPLRVTSNAENTISRGNIFVPFPFDLSLPDDQEARPPRAKLIIDNVDRQIVHAVRTASSSPDVLIEIVRATAPDVVEARFADFRLTNVSYDAQRVEGDLTVEDFTSEPFPAASFSPALFPGLF